MKLHPKIQALRDSIGHIPILRSSSTKSKGRREMSPVIAQKGNTDNPRLIRQYFCLWGIEDDYGTTPVRGMFGKSIEERGPGSSSPARIIVLNQHDPKDPLCIPSLLKEDDIGLYGEYEPDPIPSGDRLITQVRSGTINNGSYGFSYVWDKMEYNEELDTILMREVILHEVSPVTFGSQRETFVVRGADGSIVDEELEADTERIISMLPRTHRLELRDIISRHILLAEKREPNKRKADSLDHAEPKAADDIYDYLLENLKF